MDPEIQALLRSYDPDAPLAEAYTLPAQLYVDPRIERLEQRTVFSRSWVVAGRLAQLHESGRFITCDVGGEPVVVVRGSDGELRAFFNVCRHHAAQVAQGDEGKAPFLRCPYHGWTYGLDGRLRGAPEFAGVCNFQREHSGLVPTQVGVWEGFVLVKLDPGGPTLEEFLGAGLLAQVRALHLPEFHFFERRRYEFPCNWKVFVDNYLDGGYHIPHLHRGLDSVLDYARYSISLGEDGERYCLQQSPIVDLAEGAEPETAAVRQGDRALYYWIYPNFMINWYKGVLDTNLVIARGVDRTEVIIDFYFPDVSEGARERNLRSLEIGQRIQDEDMAICASVQRGLRSRAYGAGRLSVRREAGEHLFHRLLHADLAAGAQGPK